MCAAVPVRALLQLPLLGVNRGYKGLYGGGWPLRGMGAAGTALGAADARTNEHYEIGTILTQKSQGAASILRIGHRPAAASEQRKEASRIFLRSSTFFFISFLALSCLGRGGHVAPARPARRRHG